MKILFNDLIQNSDCPADLKNPALSLIHKIDKPLTVILSDKKIFNAIGIGNTDGTYFTITSDGKQRTIYFKENGLYMLGDIMNADRLIITTNATFIGRIALGMGVDIPTAIAKEPAFASTYEPRLTLCGQVVQGAGGYNYRTLSLDSRYKINEFIMNEIKDGYKYIGMGYPFFIDLSIESYKLPFSKLYAIDRNQSNLSFESGVRKFLYSRRWEFQERF